MISPLDYCLYWSGGILTRAASAGLDARQSSQKTQISPKIRIGVWRRIVSLSPGETLKRILGWHDFSRFIGLADSGGMDCGAFSQCQKCHGIIILQVIQPVRFIPAGEFRF
jgi:hypothetical protein